MCVNSARQFSAEPCTMQPAWLYLATRRYTLLEETRTLSSPSRSSTFPFRSLMAELVAAASTLDRHERPAPRSFWVASTCAAALRVDMKPPAWDCSRVKGTSVLTELHEPLCDDCRRATGDALVVNAMDAYYGSSGELARKGKHLLVIVIDANGGM